MARGGHLRVGLEDAPLGCARSNAGLVAQAGRAVGEAGPGARHCRGDPPAHRRQRPPALRDRLIGAGDRSGTADSEHAGVAVQAGFEELDPVGVGDDVEGDAPAPVPCVVGLEAGGHVVASGEQREDALDRGGSVTVTWSLTVVLAVVRELEGIVTSEPRRALIDWWALPRPCPRTRRVGSHPPANPYPISRPAMSAG